MSLTALRPAPDSPAEPPATPVDPHVDPPAERLRVTRASTREDRLTLLGAVIGSLATTWLLYAQILPFSGRIGFVLFWYAVFIVFYAGLTALTRPLAVVSDRVASCFVVAAPVVIGTALASTVVVTVGKGLPALVHLNFFTSDMAGVRPSDAFSSGGIAHAIIGTLIEVAIAVAIALPLGVTTAVFMSEVGGRGARLVRTIIEAMTALPSIVAGLFVYTTLIVGLGFPSSGLAAALALAVMGLPIMARAADVVLRVVPGGLREASYALGAGQWQTVWRVVLPTARPGLATALILGIARMVGETSPLILTSGASTFFNADPLHNPMNSLPLFIYNAVSSGEPGFETRGYAAATVLLVLVLVLFVLARFVARRAR
ncbi:phosphate ABC transporter permease PstA [Nocardioides sp.]|uniref:phosphate ABC transporter permease PstA n=1 Tax=Nocardioides sp. TaxID=35761 RepID=UPI0026181056|nr:phosphate ABC transporter permease PstA [Nocardioides sp.]